MPMYLVPIVIVLLWGGLGLWGAVIEKKKDAVWKRQYFPVMLAVYCGVFVLVFALLTRSMLVFPFILLMAGIGFLSWKSTVFCDACNGSVFSPPFAPKAACPHCGSEFHRHAHSA